MHEKFFIGYEIAIRSSARGCLRMGLIPVQEIL